MLSIRRVPSSGHHALDDAPPGLPLSAKSVWVNAHGSATAAYKYVPDSANMIALATNTIVANKFHRSGRKLNPKPASQMPDPGNMTYLGDLLEVHTTDVSGYIVVYKWTGSHPGLLWSPSVKEDRANGTAFVWPGLNVNPNPTTAAYTAPQAARVYKTWHAGRTPHGASPVKFTLPRLGASQDVVAIVYASDKFDKEGKITHYIHHDDPGVKMRMASNRRALTIGGGRLRLTAGGLVN
jgi:hypothetical protein